MKRFLESYCKKNERHGSNERSSPAKTVGSRDACPDFNQWFQKPNGRIKGRDEALFLSDLWLS